MLLVPPVPPGLYVAEQLLEVPTGDPSVQVALGVKVPVPALVERVTVPVGAVAPAPSASLTVAVQVVVPVSETLAGEQLTLVADGRLTVNVWLFEVPPPGSGLNTVIGKVPALATSVAGMSAVSWVTLPKWVVLFEPLKRT